jgi:stage V sporulation protein SpoVS
MNDNETKDATVDESLLLVSGSRGEKSLDKDYVKKLSNAVLQVYSKHDVVTMRCVGAAAINNAVKAFIIAKEEAKKRDDHLVIDASFTTVNFHGDEKTGIVLKVINIKD